MFQEILLYLNEQKEEYLHLKKIISHNPLEKSIDFILHQIDQDLNKIIKLCEVTNENCL